MLISGTVLEISGKGRLLTAKKHNAPSTLAQPFPFLPFPCCTMHCWLVDTLCASPGNCDSPQGSTAIHLVAAACCDPNCSSCSPEIASCLWERSAMPCVSYICSGSFQTCPAWLLTAFLLFGNHVSRGSALLPHIPAPGQETTSAQSCHSAHS